MQQNLFEGLFRARNFRARGSIVLASLLLSSLAIEQNTTASAINLNPSQLQPTIFAGDPSGTPPDSPVNRVDPNVTSSPFAGVVGLINSGGGVCSGTAIGIRYILTAAHCGSGTFSVYLNNGATTIVSGIATTFPGATFPFNDASIVTLSQDLPVGFPTYQLSTAPILPGTTLTMVGYGGSGNVNGGNVVGTADVKRTGANNADRFLDSSFNSTSFNSNPEFFAFDFDGPDATTNLFGAPIAPNLTLGNTIETTFGSGDSGGPSFIFDGTNYSVAGVNTFVFSDLFNSPAYGSGGGGYVVSYFAPWINDTIGVPFEFSPGLGISILGLGSVVIHLRNKRKKR